MDDDTTTLISELLQKLAELQQKVDKYSQDMAQQFEDYEYEMLKDVPKDVSSKVERAIANSLHNYPALKYGLDHQRQIQSQHQQQQQLHHHHRHPGADSYLPLTTITSSSTFSPTSATHTHGIIPSNDLNRMARTGTRGSPPPLSPPASDSPDHVPSSPREREIELHGLFIPSYLPLLEGADRHSPAPTSSLPAVPENSDKHLNKGEATPQSLTSIVVTRPDPVRRPTEETISSITSDDSSSTVKRSALRRSSSSSAKTLSPRRVRFEVEGREVLPTASPQSRPLDRPSSPLGNSTNLSNELYQPGVTEDDDLALLGSSPPRPKKITSTEKLKALARNSTEDTSTWTVVGNLNFNEYDDEDELVMASLNGRKRGAAFQAAAMTQNHGSVTHPINGTGLSSRLEAPSQMVEVKDDPADVDEDGDELDDDLLSMPALTSFRGRKRFSPPGPTILAPGMAPQHQKAKTSATESTDPLEEDPLFEFEDNSPENSPRQGTTPKPNAKYIEEEDEPEDMTTEPSVETTGDTRPITPRIGIPIAQPRTPVTSPQSRTQGTSVGSFRGRPIIMSSVKNEEVYEQAAAMGDFQSFIGSVDGRSGIDASTSYQPESMKFVGTPRSLSERLMLDELRERSESTSDSG